MGGAPYLLRKAACCANDGTAADSVWGQGGGLWGRDQQQIVAHSIKVGEIVKGTTEDAFDPRKEIFGRRGHDTTYNNQMERESGW